MKKTGVLKSKQNELRKKHRVNMGKLLKQRRNDLGVGLAELARKLHLTPDHLSHIERGDNSLPLHTLARISTELELDPLDVLTDLIATDLPQRKRGQRYYKQELISALRRSDKLNLITYSTDRLMDIIPFFNSELTPDNFIFVSELLLTRPLEGDRPRTKGKNQVLQPIRTRSPLKKTAKKYGWAGEQALILQKSNNIRELGFNELILGEEESRIGFVQIKRFQCYFKISLAGLLLFSNPLVTTKNAQTNLTPKDLNLPEEIQDDSDFKRLWAENRDAAIVLAMTFLDAWNGGATITTDLLEEWHRILFTIRYPPHPAVHKRGRKLTEEEKLDWKWLEDQGQKIPEYETEFYWPEMFESHAHIVGHLEYIYDQGNIKYRVQWPNPPYPIQISPYWSGTNIGAWFYLAEFLQSPTWRDRLKKCALPKCGNIVIQRNNRHRYCSRSCKDKSYK